MNYCPNCGLPYDETETECLNCGITLKKPARTPVLNSPRSRVVAPLQPGYEHTGSENNIEEPVQESPKKSVDYSKEFDAFKNSMKESAGKALVGAQGIANQVARKVGETKAAMKTQAEEDVKKQYQKLEQERQHTKKKANSDGDNSQYMSSSELWSWLKQSAKRQLFYTEEVSSVSEEEFIAKIYQRMHENGVPAKIVRKTIQWDRSNVNRSNYFIKPLANVVNPLACLVQLNHVGKFTFVEEKTFIMPPDLPEVPMSPLPENATAKALSKFLGIYGTIALILGFLLMTKEAGLGMGILVVGGLMLALGFYFGTKNAAILEHNKKCAEQEKAWNEAWLNWQNSIFLHSFQEDINGQLSRVFDSVFECIKQVSAAEFTESKAIEQEESSNINELEQLIARRKDEYR